MLVLRGRDDPITATVLKLKLVPTIIWEADERPEQSKSTNLIQ